MATLIVTTADDFVDRFDGVLSLREAVTQSNATAELDTIQFASGLEGQTLVLTGGQQTLSRDVTIDGDLNNDGRQVTLEGDYVSDFSGSRIFNIAGGETDANLRDLTLTDGFSHYAVGGAICSVAAAWP